MKFKSQLSTCPGFFDESLKLHSHLIAKNYPVELIPLKDSYVWHGHNPLKIKEYQQSYSAQQNDVFICGYPKCGNHWLKKMTVEILANSDKNSNDHQFYSDCDIGNHSTPQWELFVSQVDNNTFNKRIFDTCLLENRLWWTHLHQKSFPNDSNNAKIIVICRNPKDVIVSGYSFWKHYVDKKGIEIEYDIQDYLTYFYRGILLFGDYFDWYKHWWLFYNNNNNNNNILWLYYEDMIDDTLKYIKIISEFLNNNKHEKMSDNDYQIILNKIESNNMRNELTNNPQSFDLPGIVRKGVNNDWKTMLNDRDSFLIDEMMFFKWAENVNDIKYYQQLLEQNEYFRNACINNINL